MKIIKPAIILVRPQLPENIGLIARAMQNFNLNELISKHAALIIRKTKVYQSLELAVSKFHYIIATTNIKRFLEKKNINSFNSLNKYINTNKNLAILFGPENSGLSNEDLRLADCLFTIKTSKKNTSLNLSHAVSIISYKINEFITSKKYTNKD